MFIVYASGGKYHAYTPHPQTKVTRTQIQESPRVYRRKTTPYPAKKIIPHPAKYTTLHPARTLPCKLVTPPLCDQISHFIFVFILPHSNKINQGRDCRMSIHGALILKSLDKGAWPDLKKKSSHFNENWVW